MQRRGSLRRIPRYYGWQYSALAMHPGLGLLRGIPAWSKHTGASSNFGRGDPQGHSQTRLLRLARLEQRILQTPCALTFSGCACWRCARDWAYNGCTLICSRKLRQFKLRRPRRTPGGEEIACPKTSRKKQAGSQWGQWQALTERPNCHCVSAIQRAFPGRFSWAPRSQCADASVCYSFFFGNASHERNGTALRPFPGVSDVLVGAVTDLPIISSAGVAEQPPVLAHD